MHYYVTGSFFLTKQKINSKYKGDKNYVNIRKGYKNIEEGVVGGFNKMTDGFVEKHLAKDGETVEEAKERIEKETMKVQKEMVEKSIEASKNAGKR